MTRNVYTSNGGLIGRWRQCYKTYTVEKKDNHLYIPRREGSIKRFEKMSFVIVGDNGAYVDKGIMIYSHDHHHTCNVFKIVSYLKDGWKTKDGTVRIIVI